MQSVEDRPPTTGGGRTAPPASRRGASPAAARVCRADRRARPTRAARLCITSTTAGLVLLGAALAPVGDRVAATAGDPVSGTVVALAGLDGGQRARRAADPVTARPQEGVPARPQEGVPTRPQEAVPATAVKPPPQPVPAPAAAREGTGELRVVPGSDAAPGAGPVRRYLVEVEEGLGVDPVEFARTVHATLSDPRSWGAGGRMAFERVDAAQAGRVAFRVALTSPGTTDRLCAPLATRGELSCHNNGRAVLNVVRWLDGVPEHPDLGMYRQYLVNHEVGHALGRGHAECPGPGELAPVMQQQSKGVVPCLPNAWPYPEPGATG